MGKSKKHYLNYDGLSLEITRRCNLDCAHCMRGDPQDMDMSREVIDALLDNIKVVKIINLTGGEPLLAPDVIEYLVDQIIERQLMVLDIGLVTNGTIVDDRAIRVIRALNRYSEYLNNVIKGELKLEENIPCVIGVSDDIYHDNIRTINIDDTIAMYNKYAGSNVDIKKHEKVKKLETDKGELISEGRAEKIGCIHRSCDICNAGNRRLKTNDGFIECEVSICANGNVLFLSELSYKHEDDMAEGNILENTLFEIIYEHQWSNYMTCGEIDDFFTGTFLARRYKDELDIDMDDKEIKDVVNTLKEGIKLKNNTCNMIHKIMPYLNYEEVVDCADAYMCLTTDSNYIRAMRDFFGNYKIKYPEDWVYSKVEQQKIYEIYKLINEARSLGGHVPYPDYEINTCDATLVYKDAAVSKEE